MTRARILALASVREAVSLLKEITPALSYDLHEDMDDITADLSRTAPGGRLNDDLDDHLKSAIRSLFGLMEAFTNSLTAGVLSTSGPSLTNSDLAILREVGYDPNTDIISADGRHYPLARRLEVASLHFLGRCGATVFPDWNPGVDMHLKTLTRFRNNLTHPTRIEHLLVIPALESFWQVASLFMAYTSAVLNIASSAFNSPVPQTLPAVAIEPLPMAIPRAEEVFDESFYSQVLSDPGAAIRYIGFFSARLHDEIKRAFTYSNRALSPPYELNRIGRAVRRMVRAVTTNLEGLIGFVSFFMRAVRRTKAKIVCPQSIKGESPPERAVRVLTAFSSAFGAGVLPERDTSWQALCATFDIRDRLTHPKAMGHVLLGLDHLGIAMSALDWLMNNAHSAILLDQDKIADCFGSRKATTR